MRGVLCFEPLVCEYFFQVSNFRIFSFLQKNAEKKTRALFQVQTALISIKTLIFGAFLRNAEGSTGDPAFFFFKKESSLV